MKQIVGWILISSVMICCAALIAIEAQAGSIIASIVLAAFVLGMTAARLLLSFPNKPPVQKKRFNDTDIAPWPELDIDNPKRGPR